MSLVRATLSAVFIAACGSADDDIAKALGQIPGVHVQSTDLGLAPNYLQISFTFSQPLDHNDPLSPHFQQRLTLAHRTVKAPVIFETEGYELPTVPAFDELTPLVDGNELHVEHRFFHDNPHPRSNDDWNFLNIQQAAADDHAIVTALNKLYKGPWVNTGASKGGETALFHRRFYPNDVVATVAYVAPLTFGLLDPRFAPFMTTLGTAACQASVTAIMRRSLVNRTTFDALVVSYAAQTGETFTLFPPDAAWEDTVTSVPFTLWQYNDESVCDAAPSASASDADVFNWIASVGGLDFYDDAYGVYFAPYDYQADTELGGPAIDLSSVADLLMHENDPDPTLPPGLPLPFDAMAMQDIAAWVQKSGDHLLFVYGQNDPWTAGAVTLAAGDNLSFVAPDTNHDTADLTRLAPNDRGAAVAALSRWLEMSVATPTSGTDRDHRPQPRLWPVRR